MVHGRGGLWLMVFEHFGGAVFCRRAAAVSLPGLSRPGWMCSHKFFSLASQSDARIRLLANSFSSVALRHWIHERKFLDARSWP
jgi:hypothetical protein